MVSAGEIFNLIILDEALHGVYVALLAQEQFAALDATEQAAATEWYAQTLDTLYRNELAYTDVLYARLNLTGEVRRFLRYNFNVLADNLLHRAFATPEVERALRPVIGMEQFGAGVA